MDKKLFLKLIRRALYLAVPALTIWIAIFSYNKISDGFNVRQIVSAIPPNITVDIPELEPEKKAEALKTLSQPFFYIGKGCQFYAFESQDKKYVLKLLKQKHVSVKPWLKKIPIFKQKYERRQDRIRKIFSSCEIAATDLQSETGIVLCHLNKTPFLEKNLVLFDRLGFPNPIYLDDFEFILQKKGILLKHTFPLIKNNPDAIREKITQLEKAVQGRLEKGIIDRDRSFVPNVAFAPEGDKAIFIDIGQFYKVDTISKEEIKARVLKRLENLRYWSEEHVPELIPIIDEKILAYKTDS